jgi:hypothetical protein
MNLRINQVTKFGKIRIKLMRLDDDEVQPLYYWDVNLLKPKAYGLDFDGYIQMEDEGIVFETDEHQRLYAVDLKKAQLMQEVWADIVKAMKYCEQAWAYLGELETKSKPKKAKKVIKKKATRKKKTTKKKAKGPKMGNLAIRKPAGAIDLPDNDQWQNRFEIHSESSSRIYVVSQNKKTQKWGCSCPGWIRHRKCKHLTEGCGLKLSDIHGNNQLERK